MPSGGAQGVQLRSFADAIHLSTDTTGPAPFVFREKSENAKYVERIRSSTGIAVFCSAKNDKAHWIAVGRAYQRFALEATVFGLKNAFINQPVEVPAVRSQLASFLGVGDRRPDLVVRFGYGPSLPRSLRRPVESVMATTAAH